MLIWPWIALMYTQRMRTISVRCRILRNELTDIEEEHHAIHRRPGSYVCSCHHLSYPPGMRHVSKILGCQLETETACGVIGGNKQAVA